ncbi:MAG TPA: gluconate 2-dehydrogenase subunit 3 family protein [Gemmatimonadaceae bacterium]|nr:gluconate 2-dehydrogenase subunit 3 family protein [Gemmatimonadaceae bacterium]
MHRRDVLRMLAAGAGLRCLDGLGAEEIIRFGELLHASAAEGRGVRSALNAHQSAAVTAAAERILPASDTPGATDANVTAFIDRMLADWYTPAERDRLLAGLTDLDARSRALRGRDFVALSEADQVALLTAIDDEVTALWRAPSPAAGNANDHWFSMLKFLTVWGYFTSEVAMRRTLGEYPLPGRYVSCASYDPRARSGRS